MGVVEGGRWFNSTQHELIYEAPTGGGDGSEQGTATHYCSAACPSRCTAVVVFVVRRFNDTLYVLLRCVLQIRCWNWMCSPRQYFIAWHPLCWSTNADDDGDDTDDDDHLGFVLSCCCFFWLLYPTVSRSLWRNPTRGRDGLKAVIWDWWLARQCARICRVTTTNGRDERRIHLMVVCRAGWLADSMAMSVSSSSSY